MRTDVRRSTRDLGAGSLLLVAAWVLLPLLGGASAKEDPARRIKEAEALAADGNLADAAKVYAAALRLAEKEKDLPLQERVAGSVRHHLVRGLMKASEADAAYAALLGAFLGELDPKQNGAFLRAGHVAHAVLLEATRSGASEQVAAAAAVARTYADLPKVGAYAEAMASYGEGLAAVAGGDGDAACPKLQAALDAMTAQEWAWSAVHVATELAAAHLAAGRPAEATAALAQAAAVAKARDEFALAGAWRALLQTRLAGAPEDVLAPAKEALERHAGGGTSRSEGGQGGRGGGGGAPDQSKVGLAWKKLPRRRPFVTVTRTAGGFAIRQPFDRRFEALQPFQNGVRHHLDGGIALSFWERGVQLHAVDMTGRMGAPGEASQPTRFSFFQPLAVGETWGVDKEGNATITGP